MRLFVLLAVTKLIFLVGAQKTSDENKPYKFGFNIEGHQHRKEEKDEKGIIRGEYGFITADGYYRVTVYETDEQGRFKIVSQKNYYVGFPPGDPTTTPIATKLSTTSAPITTQSSTKISTRPDATSTKPPIGQGGSCGSCLLPTTPTSSTTASTLKVTRTTASTDGSSTSFRDIILVKSLTPFKDVPDPPLLNRLPIGDPELSKQNLPDVNKSALKTTTAPFALKTLFREKPKQEIAKAGQPKSLATPAPFALTTLSREKPQQEITRAGQPQSLATPMTRPQKDSAQIANPNQPNNLLYTFNYTAGFHGHHEDGYRNGDKKGDFFVNGRDGVSRKVEYIANEFGYQPNITLTQLKENDVNRPKEETEQSFGLKGYEFKWFYRR